MSGGTGVSPYEQGVHDAINANPNLAYDPAAVHAIATTPGVDAQTLGQLSAYNDTLNGVKGAVQDHATSDPHANSLWGDISNVGHTLWGWANDIAQVDTPVYTADLNANQRTSLGQASLRGWEDTAKGSLNFLNRTLTTGAELGTFGFIGSHGVGDFSANLADAQQTFFNAINVPKDWTLGKHSYAYFESMVHQRGLGYALAYTLPSIITAAAGGEVLAGAGLGDDAATVANLAAKVQSGTADAITVSRYMAAAARLARKYDPSAIPGDVAASDLEDATNDSSLLNKIGAKVSKIKMRDSSGNFSGAFDATKNFFQPVVKWGIGPFAKLAKTYLTATSDPRLVWAYASMMQQAKQDPQMAALWQKTTNGVVLDARGMPMHLSPGQSFAESLGFDRVSFGFNVVSGATDLASFNSSDPLSTPFHLLDAANSAQGIGGVLGRWWSGLGVETGADVVRLAGSTERSRRAIQYMVDHGEGDIRKMFKGMYDSKTFKALADAKTWDEVVDIHADIADGAGLTGYVLPTSRVFRIGTRAIGSAISRIFDAGLNVFGRTVPSADLLRSVDMMNEELAKAGLPEIDMNWETRTGQSNIRVLARSSLRKRLNALSTEAIWKIDDAQAKGEIPALANYAFKLGDKDAIPVLQRMFLQTGQFNARAVEALGDVLRSAKTNIEFGNALVNLSTVLVSGQLGVVAGDNYAILKEYFEPMIKQDFENLYGFRGGGAFKDKRLYVPGAEGMKYSTWVSPDDPNDIGLYGSAFSQMRQGRFIDPRQIAGMVSKYAKAALVADNTIINKASEARILEDEAMARVASITNATVKDARVVMQDLVDRRTKSYFKQGLVGMAQGYRDGFTRVVGLADRAMNAADLSESQKFVRYAKGISGEALKAARNYKGLVEQADAYNALKKAADDATRLGSPDAGRLRNQLSMMVHIPSAEISRAKGTLQALMDMEARVYKAISTTAVPLKHFDDLAKLVKLADSQEAEKKARQELVSKMAKFRSKQINYLRVNNKVADALNKGLSYLFIPEMLSTGAYLIRISASEALLNISRIGSINYFESRLAASIVKHELDYMPLTETKNIGEDGKPVDVKEVKLLTSTAMSTADKLMAPVKFAGALYMGSLTGAERGLLEALSPERFERMLSDFAMALKMCGGHTADISHGINQIYGTGREAAAMAQLAYGTNEEGDSVVSNTRFVGDGYTKADKAHIASALFNQLQLLRREQRLYFPIVEDINEMMGVNGYKYSGLSKKQAFDQLVEKQMVRLMRIPESELKGFGAWGKLLSSDSSGDPVEDFARANVYAVWNSLSGERSIEGLGTESIFHQDLIDQVLTGNIKSESELAGDYIKAKGLYPMHLIAASDARSSWETEGVRKWLKAVASLPRLTNQVVLDRLFGNIVSWMSREPVFLWEFHVAMEELRPQTMNRLFEEEGKLVARPAITQDQAQLIAVNRAFRRMVQYVHNPSDRFAFEQATRIFSPFWFAKNQSYRRAFRMLDDDPAAFVRYLRICMRVTQYFHLSKEKNSSYLGMPGGSEAAQFAVNALASGNDLLGNFYTNLGFTMLGDPSAVQTVDPLGADTGVNMIENILRPDASPYVSVITKMSAQALADSHVIDAQTHAQVLQFLLGPIGAKTGIFSDLFPSSFWRDTALYTADAVAYKFFGQQLDWGGVGQSQVTALHEALQNVLSTYIDEYMAMHNIKTPTGTDNVNALHFAQEQASIYFNEGTNLQQFIERSYVAALALSFGRLLPAFFSPISPVVQANFSKDKFNDFANLKMPDGSQIPFGEAQYLFAQAYPQEWVDTISSSQNPFDPFPETNVAGKWYQSVPELMDPNTGYPNLFAYGIPRNGTYLPGMYQNLVSMGLRSRDTPEEYINTFLASAGDDFYYGQLMPQFYNQYGKYYGDNDPRNTISYYGEQQLKAAALNWGNNNNPTWLQMGSPFGTLSKPKEIKAVEQLGAFLNDPEAIKKVTDANLWTTTEVNQLQQAYNDYQVLIEQIKATTSSSGKWGIEQELAKKMDAYATKPENQGISYFLTSVLAKAPTK